MKIAILGASGFIGQNLIKYLSKETTYSIVGLCLNPKQLNYLNNNNVKIIKTNVFNKPQLKKNLKGAQVIYYLIHMMGQTKRDFYNAEEKAAHNFINSIDKKTTKKIIYLGGLGQKNEELSKHLKSRHNTGLIIKKSGVPIIEFRSSMVIGEGSIAFDIIKNLVSKLPIIPLPAGYNTKTQPIGLNDTLKYLVEAINIKSEKRTILEIGGPQVLTYKNLFEKYAKSINKKVIFITKPTIPKYIAKIGLNFFTPKKHSRVGAAMLNSLNNEMVVTSDLAKKMFPCIKPEPIEKYFE